MYFKMIKELTETTWAKQMVSSYKRVLAIRMEGILSQTKLRLEREKKRNQKVRFSAIRTCMRVSGYLVFVLVLCAMFFPPLVMNYVRVQIREGEWVNLDPPVDEKNSTIDASDSKVEDDDDFDESEDEDEEEKPVDNKTKEVKETETTEKKNKTQSADTK